MKLKRILLFYLFSIFISLAFTQTDTLVDSRDQQVYPIIKIGKTQWFQENLRYETSLSHCPNFNKKKKDCNKGNFYSYLELDTICPKGWQVATVTDWEDYIAKIGTTKKAILIKDGLMDKVDRSLEVDDEKKVINLFDPHDPLQLEAIGWVEGKKRKKIKTATFWAYHEDKRLHMHIGKNGYVKHAHDHHIKDSPKKNRKFTIRCICKE